MSESLTAMQLLELHRKHIIRVAFPQPEEMLVEVEQGLKLRFPEDYRQFLLIWNGGEFDNVRLYLYELGDINDLNPDEHWSQGLPGMIFFGSDGGDSIFYFDPENYLGRGCWAVYICGRGSLSFEYSTYVASSFTHLIQRALNGEDVTSGRWLKDEGFTPRPD